MTEASLLQVRGLCLDTPGGRPLFRDLGLALGRTDRVALVGRNGAGKSALLEVLAGRAAPEAGEVLCRGRCALVPQQLDGSGASPGELRRRHLHEALAARPDLLLLDEPTRDLDAAGSAWLMRCLAGFRGALLVVSHRPQLLRAFGEFFVVAESGCRHFAGSFGALLAELERDGEERERRYVQGLQRLLDQEQHRDSVQRRRARKANLGRIHELRRCPSRLRLNGKRGYAQMSQGKRAVLQRERIETARRFAKAARRALAVELPLELALPALPEAPGGAIAVLDGVSARAGDRTLFANLSLALGRERLGIAGPNGSGKSTLVEILTGLRRPTLGRAWCDARRIGYVAQDAANWCSSASLLEHLGDPEAAARVLRAHRFPFALAERPLASLSPGERLRAALIAILQREPAAELLVLDEPGDPLDFLGAAALQSTLGAWRGGLCVVSHDEDLFAAIGIERMLRLAPQER